MGEIGLVIKLPRGIFSVMYCLVLNVVCVWYDCRCGGSVGGDVVDGGVGGSVDEGWELGTPANTSCSVGNNVEFCRYRV